MGREKYVGMVNRYMGKYRQISVYFRAKYIGILGQKWLKIVKNGLFLILLPMVLQGCKIGAKSSKNLKLESFWRKI